jgi:hypothetical protein
MGVCQQDGLEITSLESAQEVLLDLSSHALRDQDHTPHMALGLFGTEANFITHLTICTQDIADAQSGDLSNTHTRLMRKQEHAAIAAGMTTSTDVEQTALDVALIKYTCL